MKIPFLFLALFASVASASISSHMIGGGSGSSLNFSNSSRATGVETDFKINLNYDYYLGYGFQFGIDISATITDDTDYYTPLVGPTFNFSFDEPLSLNNAFFFAVKAGVVIVSYDSVVFIAEKGYSAGRESDFVYMVEVGKRFSLADNIAWSPELRMIHMPGLTYSDPVFSIIPFRIDVFF